MSAHHMTHIAHKALETIQHETNPVKGAGYGALVAGGVPLALGLFGLALTPVGWAVALGAGGVGGFAYVKRKLSH